MSYKRIIMYVSVDGISTHNFVAFACHLLYWSSAHKTKDQNGTKVCFQQPVPPAHY